MREKAKVAALRSVCSRAPSWHSHASSIYDRRANCMTRGPSGAGRRWQRWAAPLLHMQCHRHSAMAGLWAVPGAHAPIRGSCLTTGVQDVRPRRQRQPLRAGDVSCASLGPMPELCTRVPTHPNGGHTGGSVHCVCVSCRWAGRCTMGTGLRHRRRSSCIAWRRTT